MSAVFVDTVGLVALWDEDDQWHAAAEAAWKLVLISRSVPYITTYVLAECANAAARRPYRSQVDLLRSQFETAGRLVRPTEEEWRRAWRDYTSGSAGDAGLIDHLSFLVMRRLAIFDAFTNDRHFKAAGFNTLI
jgi:predicted nucleic acid-binding protein